MTAALATTRTVRNFAKALKKEGHVVQEDKGAGTITVTTAAGHVVYRALAKGPKGPWIARYTPPPTPWEQLPPGIQEVWKIAPDLVTKVEKTPGTVARYKCETETHRYVWTLVRSRQQWTVSKKEK